MRPNSGFTLIEITMVLVLLGILAAVAVPKYFDYQEAAEQRAALASVAEAQARLEATFGEKILEGYSCGEAVTIASKLDNLADDRANAFGEYTLKYEGQGITVKKDGQLILANAYFTYPVCADAVMGNNLFNKNFASAIKDAMINGFNTYRGDPDFTGIKDPTWQLNGTYGGNTIRASDLKFEALTGKTLAGIDVATWAFNPHTDYKTMGNGYFFWTDKTLTTNDINKDIPVVVYDTKTGGYSVAIAKVGSENSGQRPILLLGAPGKMLEDYKTYNNTSKTLSAAEAQSLYNAIKSNQ